MVWCCQRVRLASSPESACEALRHEWTLVGKKLGWGLCFAIMRNGLETQKRKIITVSAHLDGTGMFQASLVLVT